MEMQMEFYVYMDMHVYVYVCVRDDSRDYSYTPSMSCSPYTQRNLVPPHFVPRIGIS